ncbi:MAG: hypothetical protein ACRDXB_07865 [Actinomycetes bacterium]
MTAVAFELLRSPPAPATLTLATARRGRAPVDGGELRTTLAGVPDDTLGWSSMSTTPRDTLRASGCGEGQRPSTAWSSRQAAQSPLVLDGLDKGAGRS